MKKNEKKQQDQDVKIYDFRHCNEEISIGVFVDSDLSKTVANVIYRHCSDIETEDLARELHREGTGSENATWNMSFTISANYRHDCMSFLSDVIRR